MNTQIPSTLADIHAFVQQNEPPGRVWALGSARGYASWLFLRRIPLDRDPSLFVARGYIQEFIERSRSGSTDPDLEIADEVRLLDRRANQPQAI